jgi:T5SS/PEP-CTERM-associated repeat protein/autotransporter-associated beta strand protein
MFGVHLFLGIDMTQRWFGATLAVPRTAFARWLGGTAMAALSLAGSAHAAPPSWVGNSSTDWFTAGNWSTAVVPTTTDDVTVDTTSPHTTAINGGAAASQQIFVGAIGAGNLAITNGGSLATSSAGYLGFFTNGVGVVTVDGAGSQWTTAGGIDVGESGRGRLSISNDGTVTSAGAINIGYFAGSSGLVAVDGAGSTLSLTSAAGLYVGAAGNGTLTITNGGAVTGINMLVGEFVGGPGSILVDGAGSSLTMTNALSLGQAAQGTLVIRNGGAVTTANAAVGGQTGSPGGSVVIDGVGSSWTLGNLLYVSFNSPGSVAVTHGASLNTSATAIGLNSGSNGSISVDGAGSSWTNGSTVSIGEAGTGALSISNGGAVSVAGQLVIANQAGSNGALNIGAAPGSAAVAPGTLSTASIQFGAGTGAINFNHTSSAYLFSPDITGAGAVNQLSGHTILTGNESYTGPTSVSGGTLSVNTSIASSSLIKVNAGGTLGGIGTAGNTTINSGGVFAPGNGTAGSSMNVSGNLAFQSGAQYLIALSPATSSTASVSGTATLGGATVAAGFAAGSYIAKQYTILTAASVNGTFKPATANTNLPSGFTTSLGYDATHAYLDLTLGLSPASGSLNVNQQNVANAIVGFFNANGSIPMVFGQLTPAGLTRISGETATGSQQATFGAMNLFMGVMTDPFSAGRSEDAGSAAMGYASADPRSANAMFAKAMSRTFESRWNVWGAGYGGSQTTSGDSALGSNDAASRIGGVAVGADYWFSPKTMAGFALAGGGTSFSVNGQGTGRSDLFQSGAFVRHTEGNSYITAAVAYGWQDITTDRTVTIAGVDQPHANLRANAWSGRVEGGNRYVTPWLGITPYAAAQFTTFVLPGYSEQALAGTNTFVLNYAGKDVTAARSELGLRADKSYALQTGILTLRGRAAWAHDFNTDRAVSATFQTLPSASFVVNGAAQASDAALVTGSAEVKWLNGFSLAGIFEGEFSNVTRSYAGKGVLRYQW